MTKQTKRFYHEGDGIIREIITTEKPECKQKSEQNNKKENESKSLQN